MSERADVVVAGGGIVGAAVAYELAGQGAEVAVVERRTAGGLQSRRALGYVYPLTTDVRTVPLAVAAARRWAELPGELGADLEWRPGGCVTLASTTEELAAQRAWADATRPLGTEARALSPEEVHSLIPGLSADGPGAVLTPVGGHAEPTVATPAIVAAARARGARFFERRTVTGVTVARDRVTGVATDAGPVAAPIVVVAAGLWSGRLLRGLGLRLPTVVLRGLALETTPVDPITPYALYAGGLAFRQRPGGSVYGSWVDQSIHDITLDSFRYARDFARALLHNRELLRIRVNANTARSLWHELPGSPGRAEGFDGRRVVEPRPDRKVTAASMRRLGELLPALRGAGVAREWGEPIEVTPDELPVIGPAGEPQGLLLATAFSGHGFALAPIAGQLIAQLAAGRPANIDLDPVRFARFAERDVRVARSGMGAQP